jgi:hypothetical protein
VLVEPWGLEQTGRKHELAAGNRCSKGNTLVTISCDGGTQAEGLIEEDAPAMKIIEENQASKQMVGSPGVGCRLRDRKQWLRMGNGFKES